MSEEWWTIEGQQADDQAAAPTGLRETIPDGDHELQVLEQSADADRLSLRLADPARRWGLVFVDFYKANRDGTPNTKARARMAELATALGMTAEQWLQAVRAGDLVGRRVIATTRQWQQGERTRVAVDRYAAPLAAAEAEKPAKARPRTHAQKVAASTPEDDIPF